MKVVVPEIDELFQMDPLLREFEEEIRRRYGNYSDFLSHIEKSEGGLGNFALGHKMFGPQVCLILPSTTGVPAYDSGNATSGTIFGYKRLSTHELRNVKQRSEDLLPLCGHIVLCL